MHSLCIDEYSIYAQRNVQKQPTGIEHPNFAPSLAHIFVLSLLHFSIYSPSLTDMNRKLISDILPALPIFVAYFGAPQGH